MGKVRLATVWLDGCSGCHMSLLDIDDRLADIAGQIDLVYSPLVDVHDVPAQIDVLLPEAKADLIRNLQRRHGVVQIHVV